MFATIEDLILARAAAMAEHNGAPVSTVFIIGATAQLHAELISTRDRLLHVQAGSEHVGAGGAAAAEPAIAEPEETAVAEPEKPAKASTKAVAAAVEAAAPAEATAPTKDSAS